MQINIPLRLRQLRNERGLTQGQVAIKIRKKSNAYQAYEEGRAVPPLDVLIKLAEAYGFYSIDRLLGIEKEQQIALDEIAAAYHAVDPEKRKIVDFILNFTRQSECR